MQQSDTSYITQIGMHGHTIQVDERTGPLHRFERGNAQ